MSRCSSCWRSFIPAFCLCSVILFFSPASLCQDASTGALGGVITDSSGSRISPASVVLINSATGIRFSTQTDNQGQYTFQLLTPGEYSARAEAQGMSPQISPPIKIELGAATELN